MPLYACEHCGFTSAAFRNDAAAGHRLESPDCDGVIRIIFRSEDRYRGSTYPHPAPVAAQSTHERHAAANQRGRAFSIREQPDLDGMLRLTLLGDLDLTTADAFRSRLAELKLSGRPLRLDLSELVFIDSSGIQALLAALTDARWTGWQLVVAQQVSSSVARAAEIVGIAQVLWPPDPNPDPKPASSRSTS